MGITPEEFLLTVRRLAVDYLDFGCSTGGSLSMAHKVFDGRAGLGIDIDPRKIAAATAAGFHVINFDIGKMPEIKLVDFTVMSHFLEHIADCDKAALYLRKACDVSRSFVYIAQPYFDADGYLARLGFKIYWSDWSGHPNRMTSLEMGLAARDLFNHGYCDGFSIFGRGSIISSDDPCIHSLRSPIDQHKFDVQKHPLKRCGVKFGLPIHRELVCLIWMNGMEREPLLSKLSAASELHELIDASAFDH